MATGSEVEPAGDAGGALWELASFAAETAPEHLPEPTRNQGLRILADTVGVMLDGARLPEWRRLTGAILGAGPATLIGPGCRRAPQRDAAFVNAVSGCRTELDEATWPTGHPAVHVLPVALAQAQAQRASGAELLAAFVLGYEVHARVQRAAGPLRSGVHCHGNVGHLGAVAALGRLRGWDRAQMFAGINGAAALACATTYDLPMSGASMHAATPAVSASVAYLVADMVAAGFTSDSTATSRAFGEVLGDRFDPAELVDELGSTFAVDRNYVKFHATCGHAHAVIDAIGDAIGPLVRTARPYPWAVEVPFTAPEVASITVTVSERAASLGGLPQSRQSLAARFSIPYAVATVLRHGHAGPELFDGSFLDESETWDLARRVRVESDPSYAERAPAQIPAEVEIVLTDGRRYWGSCVNAYGNLANQASEEHLRAKFVSLAAASVPDPDALWRATIALESLADVSDYLSPVA